MIVLFSYHHSNIRLNFIVVFLIVEETLVFFNAKIDWAMFTKVWFSALFFFFTKLTHGIRDRKKSKKKQECNLNYP